MRQINRESLGMIVRDAWVRWAKTRPDCNPRWLVPWEDLDDPTKEVDRQIGEAVQKAVFAAQGET